MVGTAPEMFISARKHKKKDRKVHSSEEPVMTGSLYRGSTVVPDCVKLREAVLFEDRFGTFGRVANFKNGKQGKKQRVLDKVWMFAAHHKLEAIKRRKFSTLEQERRRAVLNYLASDHYVERELYTFNLRSEVMLTRDGSRVAEEKVCLAFEELPEALKWRQAIARQIGALRRSKEPSLEPGASRRDLYLDGDDGEDADDSPRPGLPAFRPDAADAAQPIGELLNTRSEFDSATTNEHTGSIMATQDMKRWPATPISHSVFDDEEYFALPERSTSLETLQAEIRTDSRTNGGKLDDWRVVSSDNNITVLRGREQHNANSIMLSYVIRAPPRLCVKSLLRGSQQGQADNLYLDIEVEESVDAFNDVLLTTWQPTGLGRFFMAPRCLRMRRLWRREDDGSYVTLFTALDSKQQPPARHWLLDWFAPIPCKLVDTCVTFSPLNSEFSNHNGHSSETLVTHVSCHGDLGGWMSQGHPLRQLLSLVAPFSSATSWRSFIKPHVELGVAIRNKAEAARFCVRPYLQSHNESVTTSPAAPPVPAASPRESRASADPLPSTEIRPPVSSFAEPQDAATDSDGVGRAANGCAVEEEEQEDDASLAESSLTPRQVATCDCKYWACPGANNLKVRGANYLRDKKKIPAAEPAFSLAATDLMQVEQPTFHIARFLPSLRHSKAPFTFIMQIMFGSPSLSLTFSWAAPEQGKGFHPISSISSLVSGGSPSGSSSDGEGMVDEAELLGKPFELTLARFLAGGTNDAEANKRRDGTLKLIPRISQGAWFVKQAVGTTPCLLGRKLTASYHRGPGYFEVDVDVSSSSVAANIVGLVQGLTKSLCVDMAICLEGHCPEELPESLLGAVRCSHLDLNSAKLLDVKTGEIKEKTGELISPAIKQRHSVAAFPMCSQSSRKMANTNISPALTL